MSRKKRQSQPNPKSAIDIVIVTGGRFDMLRKCLDAIYRDAESVPLSVTLIDNKTDAEEYRENDALFFRREDSKVLGWYVKHLKQEAGYSVANDEGARVGSAPLIMFLNDDVELQPGAIQTVIDTFKDATVGAVGIKLLFPPDSKDPIRPAGKVQHIGMALNIRGDAEHPLVGWSSENPKTCINRDVIAITGACLTIRRDIFNKVQGFDPVYGLGTWEDVDLCFKVRMLGFRNFVNANAVGYHYVGSTAEKKRRPFPLQYNKMIFQSRWAATGAMAWTSYDFW
jgi:GT2 family glycosyltransferase